MKLSYTTSYSARHNKAVHNTWFCENLSFASKKRSKSNLFVEAPIFFVLLQQLRSVVTEIRPSSTSRITVPSKNRICNWLISHVVLVPLIYCNCATQRIRTIEGLQIKADAPWSLDMQTQTQIIIYILWRRNNYNNLPTCTICIETSCFDVPT